MTINTENLKKLESGNYIDLFETENRNLLIVLNEELDEEDKERLLELDQESAMYELMEDIFCNSEWDFIDPESVGALTAGLLLCDEVYYDDDGKLDDPGNIYWDKYYETQSCLEELLNKGQVLFIHEDNA